MSTTYKSHEPGPLEVSCKQYLPWNIPYCTLIPRHSHLPSYQRHPLYQTPLKSTTANATPYFPPATGPPPALPPTFSPAKVCPANNKYPSTNVYGPGANLT